MCIYNNPREQIICKEFKDSVRWEFHRIKQKNDGVRQRDREKQRETERFTTKLGYINSMSCTFMDTGFVSHGYNKSFF